MQDTPGSPRFLGFRGVNHFRSPTDRARGTPSEFLPCHPRSAHSSSMPTTRSVRASTPLETPQDMVSEAACVTTTAAAASSSDSAEVTSVSGPVVTTVIRSAASVTTVGPPVVSRALRSSVFTSARAPSYPAGSRPAEQPPAFLPFQLSDEMYARILRNPAAFDYPELPVGAVQIPKYGYIFVEMRKPTDRRPKLVDGYDWVPSSTANASSRMLRDGETELFRFYCARRTKATAAKPMEKPFVSFQRTVYDEHKQALGGNPSTYELKRSIGIKWRELTAAEKAPYQAEARDKNRLIRQRMAAADPAQLLVRHEMWLRERGQQDDDDVNRVLIHYLGDDAFQLLSLPPRPMRVAARPHAARPRAARPLAVRPRSTRAGTAHDGGNSDGGGDGVDGDATGAASDVDDRLADEDEDAGAEGVGDTAVAVEDPAYTVPFDCETSDVALFLGYSGLVDATAGAFDSPSSASQSSPSSGVEDDEGAASSRVPALGVAPEAADGLASA